MEKTMVILKHVEYEITDPAELENLEVHLRQTTAEIDGISYEGIYFARGKKEFVLWLECESEEKYLEWREICPPPPGAEDWYEVLLDQKEYFPE